MNFKSNAPLFQPQEIEKRWQERWEKLKINQPNIQRASRPFYNLMMFPYPSAEGLHVGNMYAFSGADIYGRYQRMQGKQVFEPMGLDGFGIHSENYAFKINSHPLEQAAISEKRFYEQLHSIGNGFSWDYRLETYNPDYYKWTQWLFVQMFKHGLAERKSAWVNWCPSCKTVLADEQVEGGVCERCKTETTRKEAKQWFFKITEYSDRLLENIYGVGNEGRNKTLLAVGPVGKDYEPKKEGLRWPEKIKTAQRQWIGKVKGLTIYFQVERTHLRLPIWTKFWETVYGTTFLVIAPEHPSIEKLPIPEEREQEVKRYIKESLQKTEQQRKADADKKTGVDTGVLVRNPVNNELVPLWIADYVLMDVGTGAVMGVPAHDERDFSFAKKFGLKVKKVVDVQNETHVVVLKRGVKRTFTKQVKAKNWYMMECEDEGYGLVVPKMHEKELICLLKDNLLDGPWFAYADGSLKAVIFRGMTFQLPREREQAKTQAMSLGIPQEELIWEKVDHYPFCHEKGGMIVNSSLFNGLDAWGEGKKKMAEWMIAKGFAKWELHYHLRDWLISRQRYWGPPIPMIFCEKCAKEKRSWFTKIYPVTVGSNTPTRRARDDSADLRSVSALSSKGEQWHYGWWPIEEKQLPVRLPELSQDKVKPTGDGKAPLEKASDDWLYVKCPGCGGKAKRETNIIDNFVDSSWYFLAYPNLHTKEWKSKRRPFNKKITKRWLPVDAYIGGAEHAVLHLLYSRFVCMALHDWRYINFEEPFPFLFSHGLIVKDGAKMSKSRGNIVNPDVYIKKYGADTLRMYLMFLGPYDQGGDFRDSGIHGMHKFLQRVWRLYQVTKGKISVHSDAALDIPLQQTIKKVSEDVKVFRYNTAIASLMEFVNIWEEKGALSRNDAQKFLLLFAPFTPHLAEEIWQQLKKSQLDEDSSARYRSIHLERWPKYDVKRVKLTHVEIVVQVNGKLRDRVIVSASTARKKVTVVHLAKQLPSIKRYLTSGQLVQVVFVPGRLVNFVVK